MAHDNYKHKASVNSAKVSAGNKTDFPKCSTQRNHVDVDHDCSVTDSRLSSIGYIVDYNLYNSSEAMNTNSCITSATTSCPQDFPWNPTSSMLTDLVLADSGHNFGKLQTSVLSSSSSLRRGLPPFEKIVRQRYPVEQQKEYSISEYDLLSGNRREVQFKDVHKDSSSDPCQPDSSSNGIKSNKTLQVHNSALAMAAPKISATILSAAMPESSLKTDSRYFKSEMDKSKNNKTTHRIPNLSETVGERKLLMKENSSLKNHFLDSESLLQENNASSMTQNRESGSMKVENCITFEELRKRKINMKELETLSHGHLVVLLAEALQCDSHESIERGLSAPLLKNAMHTQSDFCQGEQYTKKEPSVTLIRPTPERDNEIEETIASGKPEAPQNTYKNKGYLPSFDDDAKQLGNDDTVMKKDKKALETKSWKNSLPGKSNIMSLSRTAKYENESTKQVDKNRPPQLNMQPLMRLKRRKKTGAKHECEYREEGESPESFYESDQNLKKQADISKSDEKASRKSISYSCKDCSKVFVNKLVYRRHVRSHASGFQCDICGKTLKTKDSLYHHQRGLHTKEKPYKCKQCHATFNFHHSYKLHIQRHNGERPHKCSICNKTYLTSNHLKVHIEAAHEVGSIICHICGKTFSYNCSLKQHLHKHTGERPYNCDKCPKSFSTKQSLRVHATSHLESRIYPCEVCGKTYKSEHSKNVHMKRHGKQVRKFMCELCGKAFPFKSTLKAHTNIHSKVRPYVCVKCGKGFKSKASLYTHKYVHRETQPFTCIVCGKAFKTKNCCRAHMKRHENEDSYICSQCGSTFPDNGGLSKHMKTIHIPKKQFTCTICGKKGTRCDNMRTHVKSHQNGTGATINPMEFIVEENITDNASEFLQARPRMRGPRQKSSRRLCQKNSQDKIGESDMPSQCSDISKQIITTLQLARKVGNSENKPVSALHSTFFSMPVLDQQLFSSQITCISNETKSQQADIHSALTISDQERQQPQHQHQQAEHHYNDLSKASYYLAYMHQQPDIAGTSNSSAVSLGPMTSLLSAINPSSDHEAFNSNLNLPAAYLNSSASLSMGHGHKQALDGQFADILPLQGSLSQLQNILSKPNDNHQTVLHEQENHSSSSNLSQRRHLDY